VALSDRLPYRLAMAERQGASSVHQTEGAARGERDDVVLELLAAHPAGVDAVFDCSGEQAALDQAAALLAPGGTLVIVGIPESSRVSFDINVWRRKELRIENV
jgi:L-iditol 2-dehydrogenase